MGDQATEQSTYTAAEQPQEAQALEQAPEQAQTETQGAEGTASKEDNAIDYSKLGSMSQQEQLAALSKAGIFGDGDKPAEKPQDTPQQTETPDKENNAGQGTDQPAEKSEPEFEVGVVEQSRQAVVGHEGTNDAVATDAIPNHAGEDFPFYRL